MRMTHSASFQCHGGARSASRTIRIFIDGACRGNPGQGSVGVVLEGPKGGVLRKHCRCLGVCTNNFAEYVALSDALDLAEAFGGRRLVIHSDSELLVRQFSGAYKVKNVRLRRQLETIRRKVGKFEIVDLVHVPREKNRLADKLANQALDESERQHRAGDSARLERQRREAGRGKVKASAPQGSNGQMLLFL